MNIRCLVMSLTVFLAGLAVRLAQELMTRNEHPRKWSKSESPDESLTARLHVCPNDPRVYLRGGVLGDGPVLGFIIHHDAERGLNRYRAISRENQTANRECFVHILMHMQGSFLVHTRSRRRESTVTFRSHADLLHFGSTNRASSRSVVNMAYHRYSFHNNKFTSKFSQPLGLLSSHELSFERRSRTQSLTQDSKESAVSA